MEEVREGLPMGEPVEAVEPEEVEPEIEEIKRPEEAPKVITVSPNGQAFLNGVPISDDEYVKEVNEAQGGENFKTLFELPPSVLSLILTVEGAKELAKAIGRREKATPLQIGYIPPEGSSWEEVNERAEKLLELIGKPVEGVTPEEPLSVTIVEVINKHDFVEGDVLVIRYYHRKKEIRLVRGADGLWRWTVQTGSEIPVLTVKYSVKRRAPKGGIWRPKPEEVEEIRELAPAETEEGVTETEEEEERYPLRKVLLNKVAELLEKVRATLRSSG